jgi:hypothetical protein
MIKVRNLWFILGAILVVGLIALVSAQTITLIFSDGFEAADFATVWTSNVAYERQSALENTDGGGTWSIEVNGNVADVTMEITNAQNVTNQTTCNLTSRIHIETAFDGGEYICMDYSYDGGATWNLDTGSDGGIGGLCQDGNVDAEGVWRTVYHEIPNAAGNETLKYRFRTTVSGTQEDGYIDNVNLTCTYNNPPNMTNVTGSHVTIKGGDTITFYANTTSNGVNDSEADSLTLYCDTTSTPTAANSDCTGGTTTDATYPYALTCTFATAQTDQLNQEYCRVYDGNMYSSAQYSNYTTDSTAPSLTVDSVAGDTAVSYYDTVNDGATEINITGEANMVCRWSNADMSYSAMSNDCTIDGTTASCNVTDALTPGLITRYISCQDNLTNEHNSTNNLDVQFTLDYTAPTTSDNGVAAVQVPNYTVTISELDNVDADPTTLYCTDTVGTCTPSTSIDHLGTVIFTSSNRGLNYLRYNSSDDAGNIQAVQNKTININQLPVFTSASDDAITILGGTPVNITTVSSDADAGQEMTLYVCNSTNVSSAGCGDGHYCNTTSTSNMTCILTSESDSAAHTWYAFIYDELNESSVANFSGSYTTDSTAPVITLVAPTNGSTITQDSVTLTITVDEALSSAWYSLDNGVTNVTMTNTTLLSYTHDNLSIADGTYNMTFWANDSYGNEGTLSGNWFIIDIIPADVTPPAITIVSPANLSYQDPASTLINITADEDLSWAGYQLNGGSILNLSNYSLSGWNITLTSLSQETTYNLTIYANDTSNNTNNKTAVFYADSLAPRYSSAQADPSPANVSQNVNCSITWTDTYNITSVIIGENSTDGFENHTINFSGTSGDASYDISGAQFDGPNSYACKFYATDAAGNMNTTTVSFDVNDITVPVITIISPTNQTYNSENVTASITISENASSAWYSLNGSANVTMGNTSLTAWNSTLTSLPNGEHYIIFYANDSSNNVGNSSTVYFEVNVAAPDTTPPIITIDTIANATYYTSTSLDLNITADENVTWAGYSLNGSSVVNLTNTSMVNWNATLTLASESTNTLIVYANDTASPANQGNKTITFYVDTVFPQFTSVTASPDPANESQDVVCNAFVNDTFALSGVKIGENTTGSFVNHTISLTASGWMNYTMTSVAKGDYTCRFYATDAAGNANLTSTTFSVNDVTAPTVSINSPLNQTYGTATILFSVTLNENASVTNYSLDGGATNVSLSGSGTAWSDSVNTGADGFKTLIFYAIDSSGNIGTNSINFSVDTSVPDTTAPTITVWSPSNNSYDIDGSVLLNITANENISWAGYTNNSGTLTNLSNTSRTSWNKTISLVEGQHNITFYANDTSDNQANDSVIVYVDLNNPSVVNFSCPGVNDSVDINCTISATDAIGLDYAIVSYNSSGSFVNSSQISLSATSDETNYIISAANHSPIGFSTKLYVYDLSGRINGTATDDIVISDDTLPVINNVSYLPNTTDDLDPGVTVNVNTTITEDYNISSVVLMYLNSSSSGWTSVTMANNSVLVVGSSSTVIYNASFVPQEENWTFKINATDYAGNENISVNYTIAVEDDISDNVSTTIPTIKSFTTAQAAGNNSVGRLIMNNTGDGNLDFNVSLIGDSNLDGKLSVNYTNNATHNYTGTASGSAVNISLEVNTTDLDAGLYSYNISVVSNAGTTTYERYVQIQASVAPILSVSIDTYSSTVTRGQTGLELVASVTNLGTADATGVYLNWTLPSGFSLASGSINRSLGNLGVDISGTNTITVDIGSSISESSLNLSAVASSTNADSANDTKSVAISDPLTVTEIVTTPGVGGGGGGAAAEAAIIYDKVVEVIRGEGEEFDIEVENKYSGFTLEDMKLSLTGFPEQYFSSSPSVISSISYGTNGSFRIKLSAPSYKSYEEHDLRAVITGWKVKEDGTKVSYQEIQNIKLIIQEVAEEKSRISLEEAEEMIIKMIEAGFNVKEVQALLAEAVVKIDSGRNGQAKLLSDDVVSIGNLAFEVDNSIRKLLKVLGDPGENEKLVDGLSGFAVRGFFKDHPSVEMTELAIVAFERGDYALAKKRVDSARSLLLFSIKGNIGFFLYLYWYWVILGMLILIALGIFGYKRYQKVAVTNKIERTNQHENNLRKLIVENQQNYFAGRISTRVYHNLMDRYHKKLSDLKKTRMSLRNLRVKMIGPRAIKNELSEEGMQVEEEIKKIQTDYYKKGKISEDIYKLEFEILNGRLAEIEGEIMTLKLLGTKKVINGAPKGASLSKEASARILRKETEKAEGEIKAEARRDFEKRKAGENKRSKIFGFFMKPFGFIGKWKEKREERKAAEFRKKINSKGDKEEVRKLGKIVREKGTLGKAFSRIKKFAISPFGFIRELSEEREIKKEFKLREEIKKMWDNVEVKKSKKVREGKVFEEGKPSKIGGAFKAVKNIVSKSFEYFKKRKADKRSAEEEKIRNKIRMMGIL